MPGVPPFAAVIFDNDGLLLDTEVAWTVAEEELFARRGRAWTDEHKQALLGSSGADAAVKLEGWLELPGEGTALMAELHDLVMDAVLAGVEPRPGALALIARLQAAGIPIGLASNSSRPFVERTLAAAGLAGDALPFGVVVTADDVARGKPAPDVYLAAAAGLGADPARCAGLEDSPPGAAAALAAGMFVIGVPYLPGGTLPDGVHLRAASLADPEVLAALGV